VKIGFVFPGQGSQKIGMGKAWAEASAAARDVFAAADTAVSESLSELCWGGPEEDLQLTANTQPAILTVSVAIHRAIVDRIPAAAMVAGHSLGEYSALVVAGALSFEDAVRVVRRRGELMQEAVPVGVGAMAAILGLEAEAVTAIADEACAGDEICAVANLNAPVQTVVAGHKAAVERAVELAEGRGARRALLLPVSAPFHSPLMLPARERLEPVLRQTEFSRLQIPVVTNVDAAPVTDGDNAREALIRQVDAPVRWVESVHQMAKSGVTVFVEIGPGAVLSGLVRRIAPQATTVSLAEPDNLQKLEEALAA
jgi:[acyl-carrier-protein] S-malonyltransferase